jgi:hypothetical protein
MNVFFETGAFLHWFEEKEIAICDFRRRSDEIAVNYITKHRLSIKSALSFHFYLTNKDKDTGYYVGRDTHHCEVKSEFYQILAYVAVSLHYFYQLHYPHYLEQLQYPETEDKVTVEAKWE